MNTGKAIKILSDAKFGTLWPTPKPEREAVKLGIEALKQIRQLRVYAKDPSHPLLPGETE